MHNSNGPLMKLGVADISVEYSSIGSTMTSATPVITVPDHADVTFVHYYSGTVVSDESMTSAMTHCSNKFFYACYY